MFVVVVRPDPLEQAASTTPAPTTATIALREERTIRPMLGVAVLSRATLFAIVDTISFPSIYYTYMAPAIVLGKSRQEEM